MKSIVSNSLVLHMYSLTPPGVNRENLTTMHLNQQKFIRWFTDTDGVLNGRRGSSGSVWPIMF